jgi:hypothetical protein
MPAVQRHQAKSPAQTHVSGTTLRFSGICPLYGPNGGRAVIDKIDVVYNFTDISFATAGNEGEDVWRSIERVVVQQTDGVERINLQGDELRIYDYLTMGADKVPEYADQGTGNNQSLTYSFPLPFEKPYSRRPKDYSLPAELLKEVRVTCCGTGATSLGLGGGTVTITAANVYLLVHYHEEMNVELKMVDAVSSQAFPATSGLTLKVGGRLHDLVVFARGASGSASMANFTDVRIDRLLPETLLRTPDLLQPYLQSRGAALNDPGTDGGGVHNDPVSTGRAVAIFWTNEDTSPFDGDLVDEAIVRTSNTVASCIAIQRVVLPESEQVKRAIEQRHGIGPGEWRAKTLSKGSNRQKWAESSYMTKSAPMRRRGLAR